MALNIYGFSGNFGNSTWGTEKKKDKKKKKSKNREHYVDFDAYESVFGESREDHRPRGYSYVTDETRDFLSGIFQPEYKEEESSPSGWGDFYQQPKKRSPQPSFYQPLPQDYHQREEDIQAMITPLVNQIKEMRKEISGLQANNEELKAKLTKTEGVLNFLVKSMQDLAELNKDLQTKVSEIPTQFEEQLEKMKKSIKKTIKEEKRSEKKQPVENNNNNDTDRSCGTESNRTNHRDSSDDVKKVDKTIALDDSVLEQLQSLMEEADDDQEEEEGDFTTMEELIEGDKAFEPHFDPEKKELTIQYENGKTSVDMSVLEDDGSYWAVDPEKLKNYLNGRKISEVKELSVLMRDLLTISIHNFAPSATYSPEEFKEFLTDYKVIGGKNLLFLHDDRNGNDEYQVYIVDMVNDIYPMIQTMNNMQPDDFCLRALLRLAVTTNETKASRRTPERMKFTKGENRKAFIGAVLDMADDTEYYDEEETVTDTTITVYSMSEIMENCEKIFDQILYPMDENPYCDIEALEEEDEEDIDEAMRELKEKLMPLMEKNKSIPLEEMEDDSAIKDDPTYQMLKSMDTINQKVSPEVRKENQKIIASMVNGSFNPMTYDEMLKYLEEHSDELILPDENGVFDTSAIEG